MIERIGQRFGDYFLVQLLGRGNFADVYLGEDSSRQQAAIKVLRTELADQDARQFLTQAESFSRLDHPHIVRILAYGVENNEPFMVMYYAPHGTLRQRHAHGARLPITTIVSYVKQVADALQYVHDQGLIHRDVKPHNMLLGKDYEVMLSDFGIAVIAQKMGYRIQKVQEFEGTILYAAPEQIRGRPRIASDQYALGVVVYEWLSGSCPFYGTVEEIASQHTLSSPPPLRGKIPTISPAVEQVVLKALAKDPNERFESVQEFAKALERASRPGQPGMGTRQASPPSLPPSSPLPPKTSSPGTTTLTPQVVTLLTYHGHSDSIHALAWSPDGKSIASASDDATVQVWNATTGRTIFTYRGHRLGVKTVAWSLDGKRIASGSEDKTVQVWDAATGGNIVAYYAHGDKVNSLTWSPGGTHIASASDDATVHVWDASTGRKVFTYSGHTASVTGVAWSPDGIRIASSSLDETVQVWHSITSHSIFTYSGHSDWVSTVAWSPDGQHIASGSWDKTVQIWKI